MNITGLSNYYPSMVKPLNQKRAEDPQWATAFVYVRFDAQGSPFLVPLTQGQLTMYSEAVCKLPALERTCLLAG